MRPTSLDCAPCRGLEKGAPLLVPMVRTTICWAVFTAREDDDDVHTALANYIGSDDCDASVYASRVLVNDIAERASTSPPPNTQRMSLSKNDCARDGTDLGGSNDGIPRSAGNLYTKVTLPVARSFLRSHAVNPFRSGSRRNRLARFSRPQRFGWLCRGECEGDSVHYRRSG
jgi:hypothetical protein